MTTYPTLRNLLVSVMSADVGLSEECEEAALIASMANSEYRYMLKKELEMAFSDPDLSWMSLLDNERYCVYPADSEEEAEQYIKERLWNRIASME